MQLVVVVVVVVVDVVVVDSVSLVTRIEFSENAEVQLQNPEGARRDQ